jgi:hypothetical protein
VTANEYKQRLRLEVRRWYRDREGKLRRTRLGINIAFDDAGKLWRAAKKAAKAELRT